MTFGETVKAARLAKGISVAKLAEIVDYDTATIWKIEHGDNPSYESAKVICEALELEYPFDGFRHQRKWLREAASARTGARLDAKIKAKEKPKRKDTTAKDAAEARLLDISYGTYIAYKETGYLETFKRQQAKDRDKGKNIIESNVIGAGNTGRRRNNVGGSKLS